jgi:hypothetical protein
MRDSFMRNVLVICIVVAPLLHLAVGRSQSLPLADFDHLTAEHHLKDLTPFGKTSLHEAEQGSDGRRGFGLLNPYGRRIAFPDPPPPPFGTELEWDTYYSYCRWDAIVRAINLDSMPILTRDQTMIYTVSHFAVVDTIKTDAPFTSDQYLVVYRLGGEVEDGGEILHINTPDMAPFEPHRTYILILQRDKDASVRQYSMPLVLTIAVRDEKVYPIAGKYAWLTGADEFPSGRTYTEIRNTFAKVAALKTCPETHWMPVP